jgi:hypothetical protein
MSESLSVARAKSYEARPKASRAIGLAEAGRQRGTADPRWPDRPDAKPQARTCSEPERSIVSETRSDAVSGSAEPLDWWRRQHPSPIQARVVELPGVAGRACGEGCSGEGGRSGTVHGGWVEPDNWLQRVRSPIWSRQGKLGLGVRDTISATREGRLDAVPEVRGDGSSDELPVTGRDAKRPHFDGAADEATGSPSRPEGA